MQVTILVSKDGRQFDQSIGELEMGSISRSDGRARLSSNDYARLENIVSDFQPNGYGNVVFDMVCDGFTLKGCCVVDSRGIVDFMAEKATASR